jgi:hypothetical protein
MIRTQCHLCQRPPEYEMVESTFEGNPVIEILYNGGPIHEFDQHFRFGKPKAKLFLACMDIVKELASTPYGEMPAIENQEVNDSVSGYPIFVKVEIKREIHHSSGRILKIPWVRLQSGKYSNVHIGFGRKKAKAIVALRRQLADWADYP